MDWNYNSFIIIYSPTKLANEKDFYLINKLLKSFIFLLYII